MIDSFRFIYPNRSNAHSTEKNQRMYLSAHELTSSLNHLRIHPSGTLKPSDQLLRIPGQIRRSVREIFPHELLRILYSGSNLIGPLQDVLQCPKRPACVYW